jgi:hypothetical protein
MIFNLKFRNSNFWTKVFSLIIVKELFVISEFIPKKKISQKRNNFSDYGSLVFRMLTAYFLHLFLKLRQFL